MKKLLIIFAMCILLSGCSLLTEKVEGRLSWEADLLLIYRPGSDRCLLVEEQPEILALRDSFRWRNFHLECCVPDVDFWGYVYHDGEQITRLYGHDNAGTDSYNTGFVRRLTAYGRAEPNAWVYRMTVPAGADAQELSVLLGGHVLPVQPESGAPRHARLHASFTTAFADEDAFTFDWMHDYPLGEFEGDKAFLPLRDALEQEGCLLYADRVFFSRGEFGSEAQCTRHVTFYLTGEPSFDGWAGMEIEYFPAQPWSALLVLDAPLSHDERMQMEATLDVDFND